MVHADFLFLLTDVDGLYSANPRKDPDAKFLEVVSSVAEARSGGKDAAQTLLFVISPPSPNHSPTPAGVVPEPIHSSFSTASLHKANKTQLTVQQTFDSLTYSVYSVALL